MDKTPDNRKEDSFVRPVRDFMCGTLSIPAGEMFKLCRECEELSLEDWAKVLWFITPQQLKDIEEGRAPFPALLMHGLFSRGMRLFYEDLLWRDGYYAGRQAESDDKKQES